MPRHATSHHAKPYIIAGTTASGHNMGGRSCVRRFGHHFVLCSNKSRRVAQQAVRIDVVHFALVISPTNFVCCCALPRFNRKQTGTRNFLAQDLQKGDDHPLEHRFPSVTTGRRTLPVDNNSRTSYASSPQKKGKVPISPISTKSSPRSSSISKSPAGAEVFRNGMRGTNETKSSPQSRGSSDDRPIKPMVRNQSQDSVFNTVVLDKHCVTLQIHDNVCVHGQGQTTAQPRDERPIKPMVRSDDEAATLTLTCY